LLIAVKLKSMQIFVWITTSFTLTKSCLNKSYMFIYDNLATIYHLISKEPPQVLHVLQVGASTATGTD